MEDKCTFGTERNCIVVGASICVLRGTPDTSESIVFNGVLLGRSNIVVAAFCVLRGNLGAEQMSSEQMSAEQVS